MNFNQLGKWSLMWSFSFSHDEHSGYLRRRVVFRQHVNTVLLLKFLFEMIFLIKKSRISRNTIWINSCFFGYFYFLQVILLSPRACFSHSHVCRLYKRFFIRRYRTTRIYVLMYEFSILFLNVFYTVNT